MTQSLNERLDEIWDNALVSNPCKCGNDDKWEQDIKGDITCSGCNQFVV